MIVTLQMFNQIRFNKCITKDSFGAEVSKKLLNPSVWSCYLFKQQFFLTSTFVNSFPPLGQVLLIYTIQCCSTPLLLYEERTDSRYPVGPPALPRFAATATFAVSVELGGDYHVLTWCWNSWWINVTSTEQGRTEVTSQHLISILTPIPQNNSINILCIIMLTASYLYLRHSFKHLLSPPTRILFKGPIKTIAVLCHSQEIADASRLHHYSKTRSHGSAGASAERFAKVLKHGSCLQLFRKGEYFTYTENTGQVLWMFAG